jgi:hypothetical protein
MSVATKDRPSSQRLTDLFPLRVLGEYDPKHEIFVAYCLETGNVATADDMDTAIDMMRELLEDEVSRVIMSKNVTNLFSSPAPFAVWEKWQKAAEKLEAAGHRIDHIELNIKAPMGKTNARNTSSLSVVKAAA